jgi:hypothetical protein
MLLLITYDLKKPDKDYNILYESIKNSATKWWHYMESVWLVSTDLSSNDFSKRIQKEIDRNDYLFIVDITGQAYQGWLPSKAWEWIKQYDNNSSE